MTFCRLFHHDIVSGKEKGSMMISSQNLSIMIFLIFITIITMSTCHYYCSDSAPPPLALRNSTPKLAAVKEFFIFFAKKGMYWGFGVTRGFSGSENREPQTNDIE